MELTNRKKAIIAEIVKYHIESGAPCGSKLLAERLENAPSTATLRNEMADLTEMDYLEQPHTSAGRLPTHKAYRLYVSELMGKQPLSQEGREIIDGMLETVRHDPETLGSSAAEIISALTGLPSVSASDTLGGARLKKVNLLPMGRGAGVIFVITDDGRTRSRLVRLPQSFNGEMLKRFENLVEEKICGKEVSLLGMADLQSLAVSAGGDALVMAPLLSCVFEMASELKAARVNVGGAGNLFSLCREDMQARQLLDLLRTGEAVSSIFSGVRSPVEIIFGDDTGFSELKPTGMIVASYGGNGLGKIAVIGPTRMEYDKILPSVEYLAKRVGSIMTEVLKGLEE